MKKNDLILLYIEDDFNLREQYKDFFQRRITNLILASNGQEGFEKFKTNRPDIIVTDIKMPIMNGIEMIKKIRAVDPEIPIIVTSAFSDESYLLEAINEGVTRYIIKPFIRSNLRRIVSETIEYVLLKKNEKLYNEELESIYNISRDGIAIMDLNQKVSSFNRAYSQILGYSKEELLKINFTQLFHSKEQEDLVSMFKNAIKNNYVDNIEKKIITKDETNIYVAISMVLMPKKNNILVTIKDLTEIKKYQKNMDSHLNLIDKYIITSTTDLEGNIADVSQAFCDISGYSKKELLGKDHSLIRHPNMDAQCYEDMWDTLKSGQIWKGEIKNLRKDGTTYWVDATISPIYDEQNNKIGYTAIRHHITDKKIIEEISITDALTDIYNRRYFNEIYPSFINKSKRENELFCFLMLDIDYFKEYNDFYGHQMGDIALTEIGKVLKTSLNRFNDYCFRLGGEEFGLLYNTSNIDDAIKFANNIINNIEKLKIEHKKSKVSSYITASAGLYCQFANKIDDKKLIYKDTDNLLYEAKSSGRNKICTNQDKREI